MERYEFVVQPDKRWSVGPDGPVLEAYTEAGNKLDIGFWSEAEFQQFLARREGFVASENGQARRVIALLTKREAKAFTWELGQQREQRRLKRQAAEEVEVTE